MILVFDLDDTLILSQHFYESGFKFVAEFLAEKFQIPSKKSIPEMLALLDGNGGDQIFDTILKKYDVYSKGVAAMCLRIFRSHEPKITLLPDAIRCLERFKNTPKYIVTNGNKFVQNNKIKALGIEDKFKKVFIAYRHGKINAKPSPYLLLKIAKLEKVLPEKVVYIGDNPWGDFVGIKPLGFKTVRILRGFHKDTRLEKTHEAHHEINSLDELTEEFLRKVEYEKL